MSYPWSMFYPWPHLFTGPLLALNQAPQRVGIIVACLQMLHCPGSPRPNRPTVTAMGLMTHDGSMYAI